MHPALQLQNVTVQLDDDIILKNVNLTVQHQETLVIIGPSGSGKTVLLKTMAGIYTPIHGHVLCEGEDWQNLQSEGKRLLAQKIGMQFQKSALFDSMTVFENVAFPLREHTKMSEADISKRVLLCLESVNLSKSKDQMPDEISGGMRQRLSVARAIALQPELLFFDDPTAGLDPINSDNMADLLLDIKKKTNATVVVVTHDISRAFQLAGRIVMVAQQEVIEVGSAEEAKSHPDPRVQQFLHGSLTGPLTNHNGNGSSN